MKNEKYELNTNMIGIYISLVSNGNGIYI